MQRINALALLAIVIVLICVIIYLRVEANKVNVTNEKLLVELSNANNLNTLLQGNVNYYITQLESLKIYLKPRVIRETVVVRDSIWRIYPTNLSDAAIETRFIPDLVPIRDTYAVSMQFTEQHRGIDFSTSKGVSVLASASGIVIARFEDLTFGKMIMIDHLNTYKTLYAHLEQFLVSENDFVEKGQRIGAVGNTGNSTNPHLHFQIFRDNDPIDPNTLMKINPVRI